MSLHVYLGRDLDFQWQLIGSIYNCDANFICSVSNVVLVSVGEYSAGILSSRSCYCHFVGKFLCM